MHSMPALYVLPALRVGGAWNGSRYVAAAELRCDSRPKALLCFILLLPAWRDPVNSVVSAQAGSHSCKRGYYISAVAWPLDG